MVQNSLIWGKSIKKHNQKKAWPKSIKSSNHCHIYTTFHCININKTQSNALLLSFQSAEKAWFHTMKFILWNEVTLRSELTSTLREGPESHCFLYGNILCVTYEAFYQVLSSQEYHGPEIGGHGHDFFEKSRTWTWRGQTADKRVHRSLPWTVQSGPFS